MALVFRFEVLWVHPKSGQEERKNQIIAMLVIFICTLASDQTDCRKSFDFPTNSAQTGWLLKMEKTSKQLLYCWVN